MAIFQVSFDLFMERVNQPYNYDDFFNQLKQTDHVRMWRNNWFVSTDETGRELRDRLMAYVHRNDSIFINEVDKDWYAYAQIPSMNWLLERKDKTPEKTV